MFLIITIFHGFSMQRNITKLIINLIGKGSLDRISVDQNCVLSLDRNYVNHLIKFHLTKSVDQKFY